MRLTMATKQEVLESLDGVRKRLEDPQIKQKFTAFKRDLQFNFNDIATTYVLSIAEDLTATLKEGSVEKPHVSIETDSNTFLGIRNKTVSATQAYMSGKIKVKGTMPDLLKLQKLL